ncbi:DegT/DnrJ/EryC1/StrS family aminotransferase [Amylibacter sp.]|nr:DegT/DnrJ/EryC1/StrS family aminotransferase [Amylibacter sp.]MDC3304283.1 DegT/DnrJ/EryC1/StrS family aminotransferase [Amylibacter sp.]
MFPQVHIEIPDQDNLVMDISKIVKSGWLSEGEYTKKYTKLASNLIGGLEVLPVPNGTLGLFLALLAAKEKWGVGEIIVPTFTFYGSATPLLPLGFKPVFIDCSPDTFQCELKNYMQAKTDNTVGIMLVHIYGQIGFDCGEIVSWARKNNYFVIEDAAQALGASRGGKLAGSYGDISVFSTYSDKALPTGEGGLICATNCEMMEKIRLIRNQGRPNSGTFTHPSYGMNFRITDIQAAIGAHLLARYKQELLRRRDLYRLYTREADLLQISFMQTDNVDEIIPFRFPVLASNHAKSIKQLNELGYQTRGFFKPMHQQPMFIDQSEYNLPSSEKISGLGICLPMHPRVTDEHVKIQLNSIV